MQAWVLLWMLVGLKVFDDRGLNLGDSWSRIESPYSHHFLVKWSQSRRGLLAGSVIHKTVARRILELNWWGVGE